MSLKLKTVSGIKWQLANKVIQKIISVCSFAVLARILDPSVFGLFAMGFVAIDGLQMFKSLGMDSALIQRSEDVEEASQTAFFIVLGVGAAMFLACYLIAPLAAAYFKNADVIAVVRGLGVALIFTSLTKIPHTLLTKQMKFNQIAFIELFGAVANSVLAVSFVLIWPSIWSLVTAYVLKSVLVTILSWYLSKFKFGFRFNVEIAKDLFHFGKFMTGLNLLWYLGANIGNVIIGRIGGVATLGLYAVATNIGNFVNTHFTSIISGVMFPAYSKIQNDTETLRNAYLKKVKYICMLSFPVAVILITLSREIVLTLYGGKWEAIIVPLSIFGIMQLMSPLGACSTPVFLAKGKPKYTFNVAVLGLCLTTPFLVVLTKQYGLVGAIYAHVIATAVVTPINIYLVKSLLGFSIKDLVDALAPTLLCSTAMGIGILLVKQVFQNYSVFSSLSYYFIIWLFALLLVGGGIYALSFSLLDRKSTTEVKSLLLGAKTT